MGGGEPTTGSTKQESALAAGHFWPAQQLCVGTKEVRSDRVRLLLINYSEDDGSTVSLSAVVRSG